MYQPHVKLNWSAFQLAPPGTHGLFFGPHPVIQHFKIPGNLNLYSLCPTVESTMSPIGFGNKPHHMIPTIIHGHPGNQHGRSPILNLAPINRGPQQVVPKNEPLHKNAEMNHHHMVTVNRQSAPAWNQTSRDRDQHLLNPGYAPIKKEPLASQPPRLPTPPHHHALKGSNDSDVQVLTETSNPPPTGRKRSASSAFPERSLKRYRDLSQSPVPEEKKVKVKESPPASPKPPKVEVTTPQPTPEKTQRRESKDWSAENKQLGCKITPSIATVYERCKQTDAVFQQKIKLRDVLYGMMCAIYPSCGLYMVGSSMTGLAAKASDLDLCLVLSDNEIDQQSEAIVYLREILKNIRQIGFIRHVQLINAKVPILKFIDSISGVEVDLNVNNMVGIRNTQLVNCYARFDNRVPPLCILIKLWAKAQRINDPFNKTLSSYSLILMVLHYLQCGCDPPVLPCLHKTMPNHFFSRSDVRTLLLHLPLPFNSCKNPQNLGELFIGFFHYYGCVFNFKDDVISVRTGGTLPKEVAMNCRSPKNRKAQWNYICIEEPFDRTNAARSVFDAGAFKRILQTFRTSLDRLRETQDLECLMYPLQNS